MSRLVPLAIFAAIAILLAVGLTIADRKSEIPSPLIGKSIPQFELPRLHEPGTLVSSEDLLGEPFVLNVWASWCVTCRYEHPVIEALARTNKVKIVGLNYRDARVDALRWLQQFSDPWDFHLADEPGRVAIDFGVYAAPETFLVDARGMIRFKHIGALTPELIDEQLLPMIESLRGELP